MLRRFVFAGVGLVTVLACARDPNLEPIVQYPRPHCPEAGASVSAAVKVVTLNLRHDVDQWERRFPLIADEIARLDPDVLGFQEVSLAREQMETLNRLLTQRDHAPYEIFRSYLSGPGGVASGQGQAILSRWPMIATDSADIGDGRVTQFARIAHPSGGVFDVFNTHFDAHRDADGEELRDKEALRTVAFIEKHDECRPTILTGDLNSQASEPPTRRFVAFGFDESFGLLNPNAGTSGNTLRITLADGAFEQNPSRRVDMILARSAGTRTATPRASIVCFKNHDAKGFYPSDHLGVMTTYDLGM